MTLKSLDELSPSAREACTKVCEHCGTELRDSNGYFPKCIKHGTVGGVDKPDLKLIMTPGRLNTSDLPAVVKYALWLESQLAASRTRISNMEKWREDDQKKLEELLSAARECHEVNDDRHECPRDGSECPSCRLKDQLIRFPKRDVG